jgi:hypothetical protein
VYEIIILPKVADVGEGSRGRKPRVLNGDLDPFM